MPRVRILSVRSLERFRPIERVAVDWLAPHPDGLHLLLDRALHRHFDATTGTSGPAPIPSGGESVDAVLAALHAAGFGLWALTAQPEHARAYFPPPNSTPRRAAGESARLRARFFVTRHVPSDTRWQGAFCPWCAGMRAPSAS